MSTPWFEEQTAETGIFWNAVEEEEVVKTVLPVKAAKEEVVVESEDDSELEDNTYVPEDECELEYGVEYSTDVPLRRAIFKTLRFSECLYSDMSYICRRKTNSTEQDVFSKSRKRRLLSQAWIRVDGA